MKPTLVNDAIKTHNVALLTIIKIIPNMSPSILHMAKSYL